MGMAYPNVPKVLTPRYKNTVRCQYCGAEYKRGHWVYGYYDEGTSNRFNIVGDIPDGVCPNCRKEE